MGNGAFYLFLLLFMLAIVYALYCLLTIHDMTLQIHMFVIVLVTVIVVGNLRDGGDVEKGEI